MSESSSKSRITVNQLAIMTTVAVASLRSLPAMSSSGWSSITQWLIPAIVFFIPTSLIGAELGTKFSGGVFEWVKEAFGEKYGFLAVWLQWIQNVVWYPTQLAMVAGTFAYFLGMEQLSNSGMYTGLIILVVYWGATFITLTGGNFFAKVASILGVIGTLIPALLLIILGIAWIVTGHPISSVLIHSNLMHSATITPKGSVTGMSQPQWILVISNVLAFAGMESNAVHVNNLKNPRKDFSKVMIVSFAMILGILILPTLVLSMTIPAKDIVSSSYQTTGVMLSFKIMLEGLFGKQAAIGANIIALAVVAGATSSIIAWLAGPSRGVMEAGKTGLLPKVFQKVNKNDVQIGILIPQGIIVTALAAFYAFSSGSVSAVFLAITGMSAALYLTMYILMFSAALRLRKLGKGNKEGYQTPALKLVATVGILGAVLGLIMAFIPQQNAAFPAAVYPFIVLAVVLVLGVPPLIFASVKKPEWKSDTKKEN